MAQTYHRSQFMKGLTLNQTEQARLQILNGVLSESCSVQEASRLMKLSERHTWRLLAAYGREGAAALAHGNRGRASMHKIPAKYRVLRRLSVPVLTSDSSPKAAATLPPDRDVPHT